MVCADWLKAGVATDGSAPPAHILGSSVSARAHPLQPLTTLHGMGMGMGMGMGTLHVVCAYGSCVDRVIRLGCVCTVECSIAWTGIATGHALATSGSHHAPVPIPSGGWSAAPGKEEK